MDNTEPTIDDLIHDALFHKTEAEKREAVRLLISDQVAKAKIEELEHIISGSEYSDDDFSWYEKTRDEYTGTNYYSEVRHLSKADRIAELRSKQ